jgi:hypothetical protein
MSRTLLEEIRFQSLDDYELRLGDISDPQVS